MRFGSVLIGCLLALSTSIQAQEPAPDAQIPSALRDWRAWVMHDLDYRACPFLATHAPNAAGDFVCAWPGTLHLDANAGGATFSIAWRTQAPSWIFLPGDAQYWPQQVTVNGQAQPVLEHGGAPALWLAPGSYAIRGTMAWRERPQALAVPPSIGLIALSVDGKPVAQVQRDGGELTLGRAAAAAPQADHIEVRVFRRLADGVPALLTTQIRLAVSGQARAESLGPVLPEGFAPMSIEGDWPARLDGDGKLSVQVQPGNATLTVQARTLAPLTAATARLAPAPWPKQEIWSYAADPHLRVTAASGAVQVDPRQSDVPDDWLNLPAFALGDGAKLSIEQRSRGIAPDAANRLTLQREAWLDFSGGGWYARDHINGNMVNGWRLDAAAPYTLEQATAQNAKAEDLLITRGANPGSSGVEWRTPNVDLSANLRIAAAAAMPVAGWQQTFDSVSARLHLPFGYKLLAAPGADSAAGSWIAGWTLLDVFVCAVLVLLAWRLLGLPGAAAAVAYLVLGYQESDAPLWSLIAVIALALIAKALPDGKLAHAALRLRALALLILVLIALPFVATQVRDALYPQLETGGYVVAPQQTPMSIPAPSPPPPPMATRGKNLAVPAPMVRAAPQAAASEALESIVVSGTKISRMDVTDHYSQTTVVQTGAGMPDWSLGSEAELSWSGPVLANQSVRLLIAPPWLVRPLRIVLVALLAFLVMRLFRGAAPGFRLPRRTALGASLLVLGTLALAPSAQAQGYPSQELLQQLRQRLTQPPKCAPQCAEIAQAQVTADGDNVSVALEAHAGERVALPLPNTGDSAMLKSVQVDGVATDAIARGADNSSWLELSRGVHRVQLAYVAAGDKTTLAFPLKPARMLFSGKGWNASGIADDRLLADSLTLARERADAGTGAGAKPTFGVQQFPPYVEVTRFINLGLDWTATTHVRRLAPQTGGFTVAVPLIKGEHVSSAGIEVKDGVVEAAIADGAAQTSWNGTLDKGGSLTLTAPALTDHAEIWRVVVSPTWHVEFSGVPGVDMPANEDANDYRNFEFHPLPGETLTLTVTRPQALQGAQRAIDAANLGSDVGQHAATHTLQLTLRTSQGGDQVIAVPADAQVLGVTRDGAPLNLRAQGGKLTLPLTPGTHRFDIRFRTDAALGLATSTPPVALGLPAANVNLALNLPANRWLLAVWGPTVGPAVLYWGELIVMILVAFALSRSGRTRLKFRDWLLLGLGFSTFSWGALVLVVAWLFAFDWRGREAQPKTESLFNLSQTGLVVLTLFALASVVSAIPQGLLGSPDMHVAGNGSTAQALQWFADRSMDALPQATAITVPLWVYKVLMLAWALWLANALIGWLRDAFAAWTKDGYWRKPALAASPLETTPEKPADAS